MRKNFLEDKFRKTLEQIELIEPGMKWMIDDLRSMRVSFRNSGVNIEEILENKDSLIKEVWKIGKAHELFTKGLLNIDGSLTSNAFDYLDMTFFGFNGVLWWDMNMWKKGKNSTLDYWRPANETNILGPNTNAYYPKPYLSFEDFKNKHIQRYKAKETHYLDNTELEIKWWLKQEKEITKP